jgi:hypothetical protein
MTILFLANTGAELYGGSNIYDSTSTDARSSSYSPTEIRVAADSGAYPFVVSCVEAAANFWMHCIHYGHGAGMGSTGADGYWLQFLDATGAVVAGVDLLDGAIGAEVFGSATVTSAAYTAAVGKVTWDFHVTVGTNIVMEIYANDALVQTVTTPNNGKSGVKNVKFVNEDAGSSFSYPNAYSEIVMLGGESTLGCRLALLTPNAAGFHSAWAGSYLGLAAYGDGSFLSAVTAGIRHSWKHSAYAGNTNPASVRAVAVKPFIRAGGSGPQSYKPFVRIASADYDGAAVSGNNGLTTMHLWELNPATGVGWTVAELSTLEVGLLSVA